MKPQVVLPGSIRKQVEQLYTTDPSAFKDYGLLALRQRKKKRKQRKLIKNATQSKRIPPKSAELPAKTSRQPAKKKEKKMHSEPPVEKKFPIQRKLRALWNRLSEGNAETIAKNLENLLTSLSEETEKEEFHSSLVTLLLESLNNHSSLVSSVHPYISSFAAVVAFLHFRGYVVISVRLVYQLCRQILFSEEANENNSSQVVHVDIFSLLILMMELYKLQIVHCQVIYELIRYFAGNLSELNAQCLLVMIRRCGAELRRDDPRALKDIIEYIREQAQQQKESDKMSKVFSTRLEMILELIYDWKDNKLVNKDANQSFPWVTNQITTSPFTVRSLQFSLEELQDWHIFYANWSGNQEPKNTVNQTVLVQEETSQATPINTDSVDKIIRQQRLNTDTRRNIFRMIMTAEDVVDAEHRLVEYGGKRKSLLREIANMVIVGCCYERSFNPFYVALTKRLCLCSSRYKIAFQFSLWNIWKRMEQGEKWSSVKLSNLASYIAQLIFDRVVTFSCFRVLPNLSHFTPSLRTLLFLILEKAKTRTNDDLLVLLQENISDKRCHAFYLTLYFLLLESKQDNHPRTSGWFHLLQSSGILQV